MPLSRRPPGLSPLRGEGERVARSRARNPKLEIRNKHQIQMTNLQNPTQSARPRRLGFEDLLLCSLEFVSDFGFRISDFARHSCQTGGCPAEENVGKDQHSATVTCASY